MYEKCTESEPLTVWNALILDLQVLVRARTGVRENVRPGHHCTLGSVVAPAGKRERKVNQRQPRLTENRQESFICTGCAGTRYTLRRSGARP